MPIKDKSKSPEIKTISRKKVYHNAWMSVYEDIILRQSGHEGLYGVVEKPDFVVILPVDEEGIYLVEQYRYPIQCRTLELPQGAWESNPQADPLLLACGELQEETGLIAKRMDYVGQQYLASGFCNQKYHIYLARALVQGQRMLDEEEEGLICKKVSFAEFEDMIISGKIMDATSVNAYGLAKLKSML